MIALLTALPLLAAPAAVPQDVEALLARIDAERERVPKFDPSRRDDAEYVAAFVAERNAAIERTTAAILEVYEVAPEHPAVPELMVERWAVRVQQLDEAEPMVAEMGRVLEERPEGPLADEARFWRANVATHHRKSETEYVYPLERAQALVEEYLREVDGSPDRDSYLLNSLAERAPAGSEVQVAAYERLVREYPKTRLGQRTAGLLKQIQGLGKPFELSFEDALTGERVSMADLRGKVVVVDFWATWCGPCVREMPHMLELYEKYRESGVEFVGVSLDAPVEEGGLERLKSFVEAREIPWPQYYQGNGWQSEFSTAWGIQSIPAVFVVDAAGDLASIDARGKLETLLPELLAERDAVSARSE